jgi:hypothetical protein
MSRAAPPGKETSPAGHRGRKTVKKLRRHYLRHRPFASSYSHLLSERYAQGLLEPFYCTRCGEASLDPLGWNGRGMPLCGRCA